jgi:alcohol dehydrogenase (cytochrome c)
MPITKIENAATPLTAREGVRFCPGSQGSTEQNGPSYSPATNLLYTGSVDWCTTIELAPDATSGAKLWSADAGGAVGGGVISYAGKGGRQRIAVAAGTTSLIWPTRKSNARLPIYSLSR